MKLEFELACQSCARKQIITSEGRSMAVAQMFLLRESIGYSTLDERC